MIHYCYLDASALVKRYTVEPGSVLLHALLDTLSPENDPLDSVSRLLGA